MSFEMKKMETEALEAMGMLSVPLKQLRAGEREEAISRLSHFVFFSQRVVINLEIKIAQHEKGIAQRDKTIHKLNHIVQKFEDDAQVDKLNALLTSRLSLAPEPTLEPVSKTSNKQSVILEDEDSDNDDDDDTALDVFLSTQK